MTLVYLESFAGLNDPFIALSGGLGAPIFVENGYSLYLYPGAPATQLTLGTYRDHTVQVSAQAGVEMRLTLRSSAAGAYHVTLTADAQIRLWRDEVVLAEVIAAPVVASWRLVKVSIVGGTLLVRIDNQEVLTATDTDPLPAGIVSVSMPQGGLVDDLAIYVPSDADMLSFGMDVSTAASTSDSYFTDDPIIRQTLFSPGRDGIYGILSRSSPYLMRLNYEGTENVVSYSQPPYINRPSIFATTFSGPSVSPDGRYFAVGCRSGNPFYNYYDIYILEVETGILYPLTDDMEYDAHPVWFQDDTGLQVVYVSFPNPGNSYPVIRAIPFTSASPSPPNVPITIAQNCTGPVTVQVRAQQFLFCTHRLNTGLQGVRLIAPVFDAEAQLEPLITDGVSARTGDWLLDAAWTGSELRLAMTRQTGANSSAMIGVLNSTTALPAITTLRNFADPNPTSATQGNRALGLSPDGRWLVYNYFSLPMGGGEVSCSTCPNVYFTWAVDLNDISSESIRIDAINVMPPGFDWWQLFEPRPELTLTLALADGVDPTALYVGQRIPVVARVTNIGSAPTEGAVRLTLRVPRNLVPQGMTITGEDQSLLNDFFLTIVQFLATLGVPFSESFADALHVVGDDDLVTFTYDYDDLVIGQPFVITLDVVGRVAGEFTINGMASIESTSQEEANLTLASPIQSALSSINVDSSQSSIKLIVTALPQGIGLTKQVDDLTPAAGDVVTFTIAVSNTSAEDVTEIEVSDVLPEGFEFIQAVPSTGSFLSSTGIWRIPALLASTDPEMPTEAVLFIRTRVVQSLALNTLLENTAVIRSTDTIDVPIFNDSETVKLRVVCEGTITSGVNRVNVRSSPNAQGVVVGGINSDDEVPVIGHVIGESLVEAYGWYRLTASEGGGDRWINADSVGGCEYLSKTISFNPNDVLGSDLYDI